MCTVKRISKRSWQCFTIQFCLNIFNAKSVFVVNSAVKEISSKNKRSVKEYFQKNSNSKPTGGKSTTRTSLQVSQHAGLLTYLLN